jgi:hypothetical protein
MRILSIFATASVLLTIIGATAMARAVEKRISRDNLPAAVRKTADEQAKGATVRGYSKEVENGQLEFEVQMVTNGLTKDVSIAPDGRVLEVEEQVDVKSLPGEVKFGLRTEAKQGKITKVESLTKDGKLVAYEAQVVISGKRSEIQVGPKGKRLDHEE